MNKFKQLLLLIACLLIPIYPAFPMEVAITVDDLPLNGNLATNQTRLAIAKKMLSVFKQHHITGVYGLINGNKLRDPEGFVVLKEWINAGHYLGNHTFHHLDLAKIDSLKYSQEISLNEPILKQLMQDKDYHYFRYPFLSEGNTQEKRDTIRQFLFGNGYVIAPVTVDFFEYEFNEPYIRCLKKQDKQAIQWLKQTYIEQATNALTIAHELSIMLFNRDIKHVLLIHMNAFTAEMLDDILAAYEKHNVKFIPLFEALKDDIYQLNPNVVQDRAYTFLNQIRLSRGLQNPDIVKKLYNLLPEDKLNQLCK